MKEPYRAVIRYPRNDSGRDFVVGDIHGCFGQLRAELEARHFDPRRDRLFAVGDLVDRGPDSDCVLEAVERYRIKSVKGNHEDVIVRWHHGEEQALSLLGNGANWLLDRAEDMDWIDRIADYMASLPYVIEIETEHGIVGIVHADSPTSDWTTFVREIERESPNGSMRRKAIWARTRWKTYQPHPEPSRSTLRGLLDRAKRSVRSHAHATGRVDNVTAVIVGHTPVSGVTAKDNVINIDTGAVYGGKLTVMDLADVPQWVDVFDRSSVGASEAVRQEPIHEEQGHKEPAHKEPVHEEPVRHEPAMSERLIRRNPGLAPEPVAEKASVEAEAAPVAAEPPAMAESAAAAQSPATTAAASPVIEQSVADDAPQLAPESQPKREPLTSFASGGMHITVRMSLHTFVNDGRPAADTADPHRR
ncbi:Serine/threonine protein phosphatase [Paraburkholderia piptadeniae]|uniref:Serine/threonine protein phosphatase n=1 Tax=Paraburkholderia piptadeniae TaxID=1701573 RepID=A0A1N7RUF1_9BURK|nr:Serine/threonine protein phosphatase [Paraburkholderia piptadeniae]